MEKMIDEGSPEEMLIVMEGHHPKLLRTVMSGEISIETVVILNNLLNFFTMWDRKIDDDLLWPIYKLKFIKYAPFIQYDKNKSKSMLRDLIRENV
jgi:hypothetical protein